MNTREELKDYAIEYQIGRYNLVWKGKSWAVMYDKCYCYDKNTKLWVFEPLPSSRTNEFIKSCRFGLIEAKNLIFKLLKENNGKR